MTEITYAVHTRKCTYLLDDEGVCRWAVFPGGRVAPSTDRAVGAQFVACLDLRAEGGLRGELSVGASALFARVEEGRFVLLRSLPIEHVEYRSPGDAPFRDDPTEVLGPSAWSLPQAGPAGPQAGGMIEDPPTPTVRLSDFAAGYPPPPDPRLPAFSLHTSKAPVHRPGPQAAEPPYAPGPGFVPPAQEEEGEPLDLEDLLSISVSEVCRTMPLYRPPVPFAQAPLPPPHPPPRAPSAAPPAVPPPAAPPPRPLPAPRAAPLPRPAPPPRPPGRRPR